MIEEFPNICFIYDTYFMSVRDKADEDSKLTFGLLL